MRTRAASADPLSVRERSNWPPSLIIAAHAEAASCSTRMSIPAVDMPGAQTAEVERRRQKVRCSGLVPPAPNIC